MPNLLGEEIPGGGRDFASSILNPLNQPEMRAYNPSFSERVGNLMQDGLIALGMQSYDAGRVSHSLRDLAQLTPAGIPMAVGDMRHDMQQGDALGASINAMGAVLPASKVGGRAIKEAASGIRAYHASPSSFDKFDIAKVGTGEGRYYPEYVGQQGVGHYFTDAQNAENYRQMLREEQIGRKGPKSAHVYEAELKVAPTDLLDFSKPVKRSVANEFGLPKGATGEDLFRASGAVGQSFDPHLATDVLKDLGYKGTTYVEGEAGKSARNYVMFDDKLIDILRKYGIALPAGIGAATAANQDQKNF